MNRKRLITLVLVLVVLAGLWLVWVQFALGDDTVSNVDNGKQTTEETSKQEVESTNRLAEYTSVKGVIVRMENPKHDQPISSPLTVTGEVPGSWSFEADFPVSLTDFEGVEIATGVATIQGDWMTTDYVPFVAELTFVSPLSADTGFLVLEKDNPSGLDEHSDELKLTVRFVP